MAADKMEKIIKLGQQGNVKKLSKYVQSASAEERAAAATALGHSKGDEAYNALISLLRDPDITVRSSAVQALVQAGRKEAVEHIRHTANSATDAGFKEVCQKAMAAL